MELKILLRDESLKLIKDAKFLAMWVSLAKKSQEFTLIQEHDLVVSWYESYKGQYDPVFVVAYQENSDRVIGILPLAIRLESGDLSHAGHEQAEYNGWLCEKEYEEEFLIHSLVLLRDKFGLKGWDWGWMPPHASTDWLHSKKLKEHGIFVNIGTCESPVYDLSDDQRIAKIKKSKSTKSKINRLKRSGELRIERIKDTARAKEVFVDLKKIANFRNLAVYDNLPFPADDDSKEMWHLNHLEDSDSVHFTVLWQGDELLACNFGFCSDDTVIIGLFTYNPVQGAHSPGNVFLIELIDFIKKEGYRYLDLSPGGDPYKERFSNSHNVLTKPIFSFNKINKYKSDVIFYLKNKIKEKYSYQDVMALKTQFEKKLSKIVRIPEALLWKKENQLLKFSFDNKQRGSSNLSIQKYADLLLYKAESGSKKHSEVIFSSLKNFERGDFLYTLVEGEELVFYAWVSVSKKKHWDQNVDKLNKAVGDNIFVYEIFTIESRINADRFTKLISSIYSDRTDTNKEKDLYLVKPANVNEAKMLNTKFSLAKESNTTVVGV